MSVHCHDDLGLAVANSLAGLEAGCRQVECAINGIGERAGNASLEEIVMLLHTREPSLGLWTGIETTEIARTSRLVSRLTGYPVQPNKAIVGRNAFAHEAGIHQDGVLKERTTYEIMDATTVGLRSNAIVLGKHSGRHALREALEEQGIRIDGQALNAAFKRFKEIADRKKSVTAMDLEALVTDELRGGELQAYSLRGFEVHASTSEAPRASVVVAPPEGEEVRAESSGDGPVDAIFRRSTPPAAWARPCASFTSTRSPRVRTRWGRCRWSSRCRARPAPARASLRTSSRRPRARTCGRCRSRSPARSATRTRSGYRPRRLESRPVRSPSPRTGNRAGRANASTSARRKPNTANR